MLSILSPDIIFNISKYLPIIDIYKLQFTNKTISSKIRQVDDYIISSHLSYYNKYVTKDDMYNTIKTFVENNYNITRYHLLSNIHNLDNLDTRHPIIVENYINKHIIINIEKHVNISNINFVNVNYKKLLTHFVLYKQIKTYPNKILLFIYYNIILGHYRKLDNVNYHIKLFHDIASNIKSLQNFTREFYDFIISNQLLISFDSKLTMSKYLVNMQMLKQLFGCKELDLTNSSFKKSRDVDINNCLIEIVEFKFLRQDDYFLSKNYNLIKKFFKKNNRFIFDKMKRFELSHINSLIHYRNPLNNEIIPLLSRQSEKLLFHLKYESKYITLSKKLEKYIFYKQEQLRNVYFN